MHDELDQHYITVNDDHHSFHIDRETPHLFSHLDVDPDRGAPGGRGGGVQGRSVTKPNTKEQGPPRGRKIDVIAGIKYHHCGRRSI